MATLTTTRGDVATYTVTQTETTTKVVLNSIKVKKSTSSGGNIVWTVYLDNTVLHGQSLGYKSSDTTITRSDTKTYTKPSDGSSSTVTIKLEVTNSGTTQTRTASISIPARTSYNVSFNANGGTGAPSTQKKYHNVELTLSSTQPTRLNYDFKRWNTATTDDGAHTYAAGGKVASTVNEAMTLYAIWNPHIQYNANYGNGAPPTAVKTFNSAFTVSSVVPTRDGYTFAGWNTSATGSGTAYSSGGTIPASMNDAVTLYAQWTKDPVAPTISSLTVVRANSSGTVQDDGTYCKITCRWSVDTVNATNNSGTVTGTIKPEGGSASSITFTSGASGTSGTAQALVSGCDTDKQYTITITVTDNYGSTSRTNIMTRAFFILDLKAGGMAVGIGCAAPSSGLELGWPVQFDEDVTMLEDLALTGNLTVGGTITASQFNMVDAISDIATAGSNWTIQSQYAHTIGKLVMVCLTLRPTSAVSADTACGTIATLASGYRPKRIQGFANYYGIGQVATGGAVTFRSLAAVSTTTNVVVGFTFMKP